MPGNLRKVVLCFAYMWHGSCIIQEHKYAPVQAHRDIINKYFKTKEYVLHRHEPQLTMLNTDESHCLSITDVLVILNLNSTCGQFIVLPLVILEKGFILFLPIIYKNELNIMKSVTQLNNCLKEYEGKQGLHMWNILLEF